VFTIAVPQRLELSGDFRERVIVKLLDFILFGEESRGAGRLFLP
jgi:hypothetical protein